MDLNIVLLSQSWPMWSFLTMADWDFAAQGNWVCAEAFQLWIVTARIKISSSSQSGEDDAFKIFGVEIECSAKVSKFWMASPDECGPESFTQIFISRTFVQQNSRGKRNYIQLEVYLAALWTCLTLSFAPFGHSGCVTHATVRWLDSALVTNVTEKSISPPLHQNQNGLVHSFQKIYILHGQSCLPHTCTPNDPGNRYF